MKIMIAIFIVLISGIVSAEPCEDHFYQHQGPEVIVTNTPRLCFSEFSVIMGKTRSALVSAEHLTKEDVYAARKLARKNAFHDENALPEIYRADLSDYKHSKYDRGHLAASGNMNSKKAQYESFSLANIIPQNPENNQVLMQDIEKVVRQLAINEGEVYIVTGPIYRSDAKWLKGRVAVPAMIYKAVYVPSTNQAGVYIVENDADYEYKVISPKRLYEIAGVDPFPALSEIVKEAAATLPDPRTAPNRKIDGGSANKDSFYSSMPGSSPKHKVINLFMEKIIGL